MNFKKLKEGGKEGKKKREVLWNSLFETKNIGRSESKIHSPDK